jgi:hypothetical protein
VRTSTLGPVAVLAFEERPASDRVRDERGAVRCFQLAGGQERERQMPLAARQPLLGHDD